jgi:hypothetical protein
MTPVNGVVLAIALPLVPDLPQDRNEILGARQNEDARLLGVFVARKAASRVPRRRFEIDTFRNHDNGNKDVRTNAREFFGLTRLRARE